MRLGAAIPILNEWRFIPAVVGQLFRIVDRCVLVRNRNSQSGALVTLTAPPADLDRRVEILLGTWVSEAHTGNAALDHLADCDYTLLVDSDELFLDDDLGKIAAACGKGPVISVRLRTYWKTPEYELEEEEDRPLPIAFQRGVRLSSIRATRLPQRCILDARCCHLSYVRTDVEMKEKLRTWGFARNVRENWYDQVWKAWDANHALLNLHPVRPELFRRAVYHPDTELAETLQRWRVA